MSKKNARSWRLIVVSTALMIVAGVLVLNVGASANVSGTGPVPVAPQAEEHALVPQQAQQSASKSASKSPSPSESESDFPPECIPQVTCEEEEPSASTSPSGSPSTSPKPSGDSHSAKITIEYNNKKDSFVGKVVSKAICEKTRRVDLFEVAPGKDQNLGHALTNNRGKYRIPYPNANGRFYTKARKSTPERNTTCKGATSKTISV